MGIENLCSTFMEQEVLGYVLLLQGIKIKESILSHTKNETKINIK